MLGLTGNFHTREVNWQTTRYCKWAVSKFPRKTWGASHAQTAHIYKPVPEASFDFFQVPGSEARCIVYHNWAWDHVLSKQCQGSDESTRLFTCKNYMPVHPFCTVWMLPYEVHQSPWTRLLLTVAVKAMTILLLSVSRGSNTTWRMLLLLSHIHIFKFQSGEAWEWGYNTAVSLWHYSLPNSRYNPAWVIPLSWNCWVRWLLLACWYCQL